MSREERTPEEAAHETAATPAGTGTATAEDGTATAAPTADDGGITPRRFVEAAPPRASFWTRIDRPFGFGFLVTLGGLGAILLGLALSNLSTVLIYIAFALFAALGLDPAVRWLENRGLSRAWSVVAVIAALALVLVVIVLAILPTVIDQIATFVTGIPATIRNFTHTEFYGWLENQFGVG